MSSSCPLRCSPRPCVPLSDLISRHSSVNKKTSSPSCVADPFRSIGMQSSEDERHWSSHSDDAALSSSRVSSSLSSLVMMSNTTPHHHHKKEEEEKGEGRHPNVMADFDAIEETCEKWAHIVSSIAENASTLRQLSMLLNRLEEGDEQSLLMLLDLHKVVTGLERDLDMAEDELVATAHAVNELEGIAEQADRHLEHLRRVKKAFNLPDDETVAASPSLHGRVTHVSTPLADDVTQPPSIDLSRVSYDDRTPSTGTGTQPMSMGATNPSDRALAGGESRTDWTLLTEDDLKSIPRTTRGHISLSAINGAMDEVHEFALRKRKRMIREKRAKPQIYPPHDRHPTKSRGGGGGFDENGGGGVFSSSSSLTVPLSEVVLTEQELRQNCAFFRSGEATARSLMLILCAVHRLRQVRGGKNGLVHYQILDEPEPLSREDQQLKRRSSLGRPSTASAVEAPTHRPTLLDRIQNRHHPQQQHVTI